jgi:hypothetical protein
MLCLRTVHSIHKVIDGFLRAQRKVCIAQYCQIHVALENEFLIFKCNSEIILELFVPV